MLFKNIIPVYAENHTKPQIQNAASIIGKVDNTYSYLSALKGNQAHICMLTSSPGCINIYICSAED
jgi:hypothetical protein